MNCDWATEKGVLENTKDEYDELIELKIQK